MRTIRLVSVILIISSLFFIYLRVYEINSNPPVISWSSKDAYYDPGIYSFNAKNKILNGTFEFKPYNYHYIFPVYSYVLYIFFRMFGIHYSTIVLLSVTSGFLTIVLMFFFLNNTRKLLNFSIISFLLSINFIIFSINRTGLIENVMVFFIALSLILLCSGKKYLVFAGGITGFLSIAVKTTAVNLILSVAVFIIYQLFFDRKKIRITLIYISGFLTGSVIFLLFYYLPNRANYAELYNSIIFRHLFGDHLNKNIIFNLISLFKFNIFFNSNMFFRNPVLTFLTFLSVSYYISNFKKQEYKIKILVFYLITGIILINLSGKYSPLRYRFHLIFAMILLVYFFIRGFYTNFIKLNINKYLGFIIFAVLFCGILTYIKNYKYDIHYIIIIASACLLSCITVIIINKMKVITTIKVLYVFALLYVLINIFQTASLITVLKEDLYINMLKIKLILSENDKAAGWASPQMLLETPNMAVPGKPYREVIEKYKPRYLFLGKGDERYYELYKKQLEYVTFFYYPEINRRINLYRFNWQ